MSSLGKISVYADIGGCFGFGANAMAFHIKNQQGEYPQTKVFELSSDFIAIGKMLFPYIDFIQGNILEYEESNGIFDLVTMFDVIEHVPEPESFLSGIAYRARFALLKTPMETGGDLFGAKPPAKKGNEHHDGHINFFTPNKYLQLLEKSGWEIIEGRFVFSILNPGNRRVLDPEESPKSLLKRGLRDCFDIGIIPYRLARKIIGMGEYLCLVRSSKLL